jgi:hypothetical protein
MKFQISKREWPELPPLPELCQFWEKGPTGETWWKAENQFFKAEAIGGDPDDAILHLMKEIEHNAGITIYVGLVAREDSWFKPGTEAFEYEGMRRITLEEYKEAVTHDLLCVRGTRIKEHTSEGGGEIGKAYFDGETCPLEEFDVYFTTEPICLKAKPDVA